MIARGVTHGRRWAACLIAGLVAGCGADRDAEPRATPTQGSGAAVEREWFGDLANEASLDFVHFNGMSGEFYYPEIMGPGVALLDYDNDGDLDIYIVQGQMLGSKPVSQAVFPPRVPPTDRLYRNDLAVRAGSEDGMRALRFTDVTERAGLDVRSYGMGVAAGDFDNDGWVDLYRTGLERSQLLRNNRDGTFSDVTRRSGTENAGRWGVSASFVDYDRDGWLDLYVGNYLIYSLAADIDCLSVTGQPDYCPPNSYRAQPDRLYRNLRNGTFEEVTAKALGGAYGPALGVSTADVNQDGWIDIYVANDGEPNLLWINQRDGTFKEVGQLAGVAVNGAGNAEAGMGVDAGDFDNDGDEDFFVTNWLNQTNTLYVNDGSGNFEDHTARSRLGPPSLAHTGFGTAWLDFDNDGWLDLLVVNGAVATIEALARAKDPFPLGERRQLFRNLGDGRFEDVSDRAGPAFASRDVGRGAAFGDIDNDGDVDVVVANTSGPMRLLMNKVGNRHHWLGLRLIGVGSRAGGSEDPPLPASDRPGSSGRGRSSDRPEPEVAGRDMLGARVEISRPGQPTLVRRARSDGSYASANDPRVLVGLGASTAIPRVRVTWPDGRSEELTVPGIDRYVTLEEGSGR